MPASLINEVEQTHLITLTQQDQVLATTTRLWPWSRTTDWGRVKQVMENAGIVGSHASPKGLRHSFGVHAVQSGVPLNLVQRWLGHAKMATTAIIGALATAKEAGVDPTQALALVDWE